MVTVIIVSFHTGVREDMGLCERKDKTDLWPNTTELVACGHGARPAWVPAWLHPLLDVQHQHEHFSASVSLSRKMTVTNASVSIVLITGWIRRGQCRQQVARQGPLSSQESSRVVGTGIKGVPLWPHAFHCSPQTPGQCLLAASFVPPWRCPLAHHSLRLWAPLTSFPRKTRGSPKSPENFTSPQGWEGTCIMWSLNFLLSQRMDIQSHEDQRNKLMGSASPVRSDSDPP